MAGLFAGSLLFILFVWACVVAVGAAFVWFIGVPFLYCAWRRAEREYGYDKTTAPGGVVSYGNNKKSEKAKSDFERWMPPKPPAIDPGPDWRPPAQQAGLPPIDPDAGYKPPTA